MSTITVQGYKFDVPPAGFVVGYVLQSEGEAHTLEQTRLENIRNNFASKVKKAMNGAESLTDEQTAQLQSEIQAYAADYKFGVRASGAGTRTVDPVEREALKLAKDAISKAFKAKYDAKIGTDELNAAAEKLLTTNGDDYFKRARRILKEREAVGTDVLAQAGI